MKSMNKKRLILSSIVSMFFYCLCIGPALGYGTEGSPQALTNGDNIDDIDDGTNAYYGLTVQIGAYLTIDVSYTEGDVDGDIGMALINPSDMVVGSDQDSGTLTGELDINHDCVSSGQYVLVIGAVLYVGSTSITITITGLSGASTENLMNWMILSVVMVAGVAGIVVLYKRVF